MRVILFALVLVAAPALANSNPATEDCPALPAEEGRACRTLDVFVDGAARVCRNVGDAAACDALDHEPVTSARIDAYLDSWTHRALDFQFHLGDELPLNDAVFPSTHNSFNAEVYAPTVSGLDANQRYSLYDQLRMDVRAIELDVHWWPNVTSAAREPVMCHAEDIGNGAHAGCTNERVFSDGLAEIARFLAEKPDEVVLLYVEDHLDGAEGYARAAVALDAALGDLLYRPAPGGCAGGRPLDVSRADILAAGKQLLVVSGCGSGAWSDLVFDHDTNNVQGGPEDFTPYPACGHDRTVYDAKWIRFWEDGTWLSYMNEPQFDIDPAIAREMTRCGVNMPGFDFLDPLDGRLEALVWTWAPGEPSRPGCVAHSFEGRFVVQPCDAPIPYACRAEEGWEIRATLEGCAFDLPRTGYDSHRLLEAHPETDVWIDLTR